MLYQDNSLEKATRVKSVLGARGVEFKKKERMLKELIKNKETIKVKRKAEVRLRGIIEENLKEHRVWQNKVNSSAVVIQRHVRGYLIRRKCVDMFYNREKNRAVKCVDRMQKVIYSMWIDLKYYVEAAKVIEAHYLRFRARKKLWTTIDLYIKYCDDKKAERFRVFEYIQHIAARYKLWVYKQPVIVKRRLEAIKKNLSVLSVKYYWTKNKLSPVKIITKVKKLKKILNCKPKITRTASVSDQAFPSQHIWRYSMITLPIEYNENILLGADPPKKIVKRKVASRKSRTRMVSRNIVSNNASPLFMNLPNITGNNAGSSGKIPTPRAQSKGSATGGVGKLEVIHYSSPMAESLGYKSFQFKVWRPIFGKNLIRGSLTPTMQRTSFLKGSHLKPSSLNPIRNFRNT